MTGDNTLQALLEQTIAQLVGPLHETVRALQADVAHLKSQQNEWVSQHEAMRILNVSANWLKALRDKPGTLIRYKFEGKTQKLPRYCRASLDSHNASKTRRPTLIETLHPLKNAA